LKKTVRAPTQSKDDQDAHDLSIKVVVPVPVLSGFKLDLAEEDAPAYAEKKYKNV